MIPMPCSAWSHRLVYQFSILREGLWGGNAEYGIGMPCYVDSQRLSCIASKKAYATPLAALKNIHLISYAWLWTQSLLLFYRKSLTVMLNPLDEILWKLLNTS
jgi:hypothetical protein